MTTDARLETVRQVLQACQTAILHGLQTRDPTVTLRRETWERPEGGGGLTLALAGGDHWEKAGVNFSDVAGAQLPPSASARRPELAGQPFRALGVSVIIHPRNPYVPTSHMNIRFFTTQPTDDAPPVWWFGGGFDLTPYYGFAEDARAWHRHAAAACAPYGDDLYARFKAECDRYFFLPHRKEPRGIGGLFFDDFNELGWERSLAFWQGVGEAYHQAFFELADRRCGTPYGDRERAWQALRRGRYVEFNLLYDRGTLFGLQSGGRTESILISLPPQVEWHYDAQPAPDTPEAALLRDFLRPRDWLHEPGDDDPCDLPD